MIRDQNAKNPKATNFENFERSTEVHASIQHIRHVHQMAMACDAMPCHGHLNPMASMGCHAMAIRFEYLPWPCDAMMPWPFDLIRMPWHVMVSSHAMPCYGIRVEWPWHVITCHVHSIRMAIACDVAMPWHHMPWPLDLNGHGIRMAMECDAMP
jgi:hypothetical protein